MNPSNTAPALPSHQLGYIGNKPSALTGQDQAILANVLDEIACGVIVLDAQGQLIHHNLAGHLVLQKAKCLQLNKGAVATVEEADASPFQQALTKALDGKRSMLTLGTQPPTAVAVVPLDRHSMRDFEHGKNTQADQSTSSSSAKIAIIFSRSGMCEALMMSFFSRAYHLTRSEEQILGMLCTGLTAPEMAEQLHVGEATVRTHIRNICAKTDSNGIREIVKRLALLPPLMAAVMPSAFA
jgi:DNA-binding CsgD family transcriptional regulator